MVVSKCMAFCSVTAKPGQRRGRSLDADGEGTNTLAAAAAGAPSAAASPKEARRLLPLSGVGSLGEELDDGGSADDVDEEEDEASRFEDKREADNSEASVAPAPRADEGALEGFEGGSCGEAALVDGDALALPPRWSEPNEEDEGPPTGVEGSASDRGGSWRRAAKLEAANGGALSSAAAELAAAALDHSSAHWSNLYCSVARSCLARQSTQRRIRKTSDIMIRLKITNYQLCIS